jgi:hypothetical protein
VLLKVKKPGTYEISSSYVHPSSRSDNYSVEGKKAKIIHLTNMTLVHHSGVSLAETNPSIAAYISEENSRNVSIKKKLTPGFYILLVEVLVEKEKQEPQSATLQASNLNLRI